jgi:hypothetical protein
MISRKKELAWGEVRDASEFHADFEATFQATN